jgi:hypothetical protein
VEIMSRIAYEMLIKDLDEGFLPVFSLGEQKHVDWREIKVSFRNNRILSEKGKERCILL